MSFPAEKCEDYRLFINVAEGITEEQLRNTLQILDDGTMKEYTISTGEDALQCLVVFTKESGMQNVIWYANGEKSGCVPFTWKVGKRFSPDFDSPFLFDSGPNISIGFPMDVDGSVADDKQNENVAGPSGVQVPKPARGVIQIQVSNRSGVQFDELNAAAASKDVHAALEASGGYQQLKDFYFLSIAHHYEARGKLVIQMVVEGDPGTLISICENVTAKNKSRPALGKSGITVHYIQETGST